jgi:uroporphyrinogen decarboxylase
MKPREKFIKALNREPISGLVPHFELVFFLTMEVFGKVHPCHRNYFQWDQMSDNEKQLHRKDMAKLYVDTAKKFGHSAIFFHPPMGWNQQNLITETINCLENIREISSDEYYTMVHGDATLRMPTGDNMMELIDRIADDKQGLKDECEKNVETALQNAQTYKKAGVLDGFALCTDYCLNAGPFLSPAMIDEFVTPYLKKLIAGYRELGFYTIKHTDGNIMPILDSLVEANPHALHSLDPQGGVDIAELKHKIGQKVCLIGNVNCGLMDTGTETQIIESAKYALKHGMPGGGYIFSTSNCVYTGMELSRYELILDVWKKEGFYK